MPPRLIEVGVRQVEALKAHGRIGEPQLAQEPSGAAADVEQSDLALVASAHELGDRAQCGAPHGTGGTHEQGFDLHVIKACRALRKVTTGLEMEVLSVVAGDTAGGSFGLGGCDMMVSPTPGSPRKVGQHL